MRGYTPRIEITGASPLFYSRLIKATAKDEEGQKSDTLTIELDDRGNMIPVPKKGTKLQVRLGYVETGLVTIGTFEVHGTELRGAAGEGEQIVIQARGTSLASARKLKETGSESFGQGSTLRDVAAKVAGRNGLTLRIDEGLAGFKFPDGVFRVMQSDLDFLSRLAERANGLIKISGDILAIAERGSGRNAAGKELPVIQLARRDARDWSYTPGDRPTYGKVSAAWVDQKTGRKKLETRDTAMEGPLFGLKDIFKSEAEAKKAVDAKAKDLSRKSGTVAFTVAGDASGGAGCNLIATGFRPEISGLWRVKSVEHTFTSGASGGWTTKFECTAPEGGKKEEVKKE